MVDKAPLATPPKKDGGGAGRWCFVAQRKWESGQKAKERKKIGKGVVLDVSLVGFAWSCCLETGESRCGYRLIATYAEIANAALSEEEAKPHKQPSSCVVSSTAQQRQVQYTPTSMADGRD